MRLATRFVTLLTFYTVTKHSLTTANNRVITANSISSPVGCSDGTPEGFPGNPHLVACAGSWIGHVRNSSRLCAIGWHVCSHKDKDKLKGLSWLDAVSIDGCFAFNAAQDGGTCHECRNNLEMDDLAGVGRACPHQNYGQSSCITGGRIDVSCCVDTRTGNPCSFRPGLATGVLCCRDQNTRPRLTLTPPLTVQVTKGSNMSLTCSVNGLPRPVVLWFKDGVSLLNTNKRIATFRSGTLVVFDVRLTDSGQYRCMAWNSLGNVTTTTDVTVIEPSRGCADGSDAGLLSVSNISACRGSWTGHVRRAKILCSQGWRVCSAHDTPTLRRISWQQALGLDGCFAYNAASIKGKCGRCHNSNMAGLGRHCSYYFYHGSSCLRKGRIDVYSKEDDSLGCFYHKNMTSGVLCCRIQRRVKKNYECRQRCLNLGQCVGRNKCRCAFGYSGPQCQHATCNPPCGANQVCVAPDKCRCAPGFVGRNCEVNRNCPVPCQNGGRCQNGRCHCGRRHWGTWCQNERPRTQDLNRTER